MKEKKYFDDNNRFIIEDFGNKKPFSSFLPGIAGLDGIPLWSFYVNRGQGICSFGIRDKNGAIMEFHPANKAYQNVSLTGFRTFIKLRSEKGESFYEPFSSINSKVNIKSKMSLGGNELQLEEVNEGDQLKTVVDYFTLPSENIAALVRKVTITNIGSSVQNIEVLDGMPYILPSGINNTEWKAISYTLKAWMSVVNMENNMPFYKLRASTEDSTEVNEVKDGNFSVGFSVVNGAETILKPIVDGDVIFGNNVSLSLPENFINESLNVLYKREQTTSNKVPCSFYGVSSELKPVESIEIYSLIGYAKDVILLNSIRDRITNAAFIELKRVAAQTLVRGLTEDIATKTSNNVFDEYCRQTYLDNLLRGGYPISVGGEEVPLVSHTYSRKHGDIERDYNFFSLEPDYYSSGNGNYRDVNQNRRSDVHFHPEVKELNVRTFVNMLQNDGYNPLVINGYKFQGKKSRNKDFDEKIEGFMSKQFTLGQLYGFIKSTFPAQDRQELFNTILSECEELIDISHGEGYWIDHFTYNIDLIEEYLNIYPDNKETLLFDESYTYYDNYVFVRPRSEKHVLNGTKVRQYGAEQHDENKKAFIDNRIDKKHMVRDKNGLGDIVRASLLSKLITLAVVKFATLDPMGMGIEMEAGKPGWNDALNGLPGLIGSSMPESYELQYLLTFIINTCEEFGKNSVRIPEEVFELLNHILKNIQILEATKETNREYLYWDSVASAREEYRGKVFYGFEGNHKEITLEALNDLMSTLYKKLNKGIEKAFEENGEIYPTYFYYSSFDYEYLKDEHGNNKIGNNNFPLVRAKSFTQQKMPLFLEGSVRAMKLKHDSTSAKQIYDSVKASALYDHKLGMYKLNESLEQESVEIGRLRAFTPGWLENETIWLHMEYKYMFELIKSGLYEEFYEDFKKVMIPYLKPEIYGRSILENSSFIASSANPDKNTHGAGYIARLSGAAAEFLSIWNIMMAGNKPFNMDKEGLYLELKPVLPEWLFDGENKVSFKFLGKTTVTYHNPCRINTWETSGTKKILLWEDKSKFVEINSSRIPSDYALAIRAGKIETIDIYL